MPSGRSNDRSSGQGGSASRSGGGARRGKSSRGRYANSRPPRRGRVRLEHQAPSTSGARPAATIPPPASETVRVIPLGGVEEIGRNMVAVEIGDDIFVIDCGFQFREDETPGVDYILPNTGYLEERRDKIRGVLISHGHLDHIGGVPYVLDRIGNPVIYTRRLTGKMIQKRQEEFAGTPAVVIREVEHAESIKLGASTVRFFGVTHTVPDAMGIIIETPWGDIVYTGDIKLDHLDGEPTEEEYREFEIFRNRKTLLLLMDSTNVWQPGYSIPERIVYDTLEKIIKNAKGRTIVGMFASHLERLIRVIHFAETYGKKVVVDGRSMKTNIEIARELGIIKYKDDTVVSVENLDKYPPENLIILATGAQGDEFASLARIGNKTHKYIRLQPDDTIVLSSSVIPGNERAVQKLKDNLSRQGAHIITYHASDVHASGHGNREEAAWIHRQIKPKFFIPVHGYHYMLRVHADLAEELGVPKANIVVPDNGDIIEIQGGGQKIVKTPFKAPSGLRVVEGHTVSELSDVLMRDRKALGQEGFCVVVATVDRRTGRLHKSPDIISRGFVYLRDNKELMDQTRLIIRKSVEQSMKNPRSADLDAARDDLAESVSRFLLQRTMKRPIVIPVIVSI
ncbi:ribonuclease J [Candidatus Kaiserbacteria bacterium CG10_big_fil_rev_8_21_14_0_10_59_10]|uniref:Ribonuclease J n=1 Tax=Candidatus Kaiserbacteria bacterium CG10_big_fil_rev_8_21_14_0_10_59_10 TaxID=1974612 RepID=A0A2H0U7M7_9BACT|nr:MAG: ribonuclease J [Candidatus Kaiserbacteria bacterium CG10_big_fil_rev_8_21_14_0_10_59_10]